MTQPQDLSSFVTPVIENIPAIFQCVTSGGLPAPEIRWYKNSGSYNRHDDELLIGVEDVIVTQSNEHLLVTTSTMRYWASKSDHNYKVLCIANNTENGNEFVYSPKLDVLCKFDNCVLFIE